MSIELLNHSPVMWCEECQATFTLNHEHETIWAGKVEW